MQGGQHGTKRQRGSPQQGATQLVSLCEVPFVLTPEAKGRIFKFEAAFQMHHQVHSFSVNVCSSRHLLNCSAKWQTRAAFS